MHRRQVCTRLKAKPPVRSAATSQPAIIQNLAQTSLLDAAICLSLCSWTVDGETYSQSNAIVRHLARKHDLYGASEHEALRADAILDGIDDIRRKYFMVVYVGVTQPGGLDTYWERQCDPSTISGFNGGAHFEFLNRIFKKSKGSDGFAVGNQLSIAGDASPSCSS